MAVKVINHKPAVVIDIHRQTSLAIRYMLDRIDATAEPNTPKRLGNLRRDITKQVLGLSGAIVWHKVYAAPQEAGIIRGSRVQHYTTPRTGPHFAENAVRKIVASAEQDFRKAKLI